MASFISRVSASGYQALFRALARRRPPQPRSIKLGPHSRVLCFTCAGIGDTLTDSVVFKALRESFVDVRLAAVVHRRRRLLLEHNPYVNQVFLFHKGPIPFWELQKQLRAAGPWDAILQLRGNDPEPRCLSFLVDPDVTVSVPNMTHLSELCGHQVEQPDWDATTRRRANPSHRALCRRAHEGASSGLRGDRGGTGTPGGDASAANLSGPSRVSSFNSEGVDEPPGAIGRWNVTRSSYRISERKLEAEIFVLGGEDQTGRLHELDRFFAGGTKPYRNMVGKLSLAESAALLASASALVSTDTGIMHLGFAVGTRVVAVIHCNNPASRVGPYGYGTRHRVVQLARPANYSAPADASMAEPSGGNRFS